MKKFTLTDGLLILLIALLLVSLSILGNYLISLFTNKSPDYSIQTQITSIILAFSTIVLVIITAGYAKSTKEMLDEQIKLRKLASIEKVLENVYSPLNNALNKFRLNAESLPIDRIPQNYDREFGTLYDDILKINDRYNHLINQKIKNRFQEVWNSWRQYSADSTLANYNNLNQHIKIFNAEITVHFNAEKKVFNDLQQLGEKMNIDESQTDHAQNDCPLSTKEWISFLNSEISNLENKGFQNSNNIFQPMTLFTVLATAVITWMLSVANGNAQQDIKANLISLFGKVQMLLLILFIVIVSVYIYSLFIYKLNNWKADKLKEIRNNIMNGGLEDTNEIHEKWSNVMRLTYREYIKSFSK